MRRITVTPQSHEREALLLLAQQERRDLRSQAALLIRRGLEELKLLEPLSQIHRGEASDRGLGNHNG